MEISLSLLVASSLFLLSRASPIVSRQGPGAVEAQCPGTATSVNAGYNVSYVMQNARQLSSHSWEWGLFSEALLELYNPGLSVWDPNPFPYGKIPSLGNYSNYPSLAYAAPKILLSSDELAGDDGKTGDPATLGVAAVMLGGQNSQYMQAATRQANYLLNTVQRMTNGAISSEEPDAQAWSDWVGKAPPFLAYYAVATNNASLLNTTIQQIGFYRSYLRNNRNGTHYWQHIDSLATDDDPGFWSAGNGYAAMGMARVLAVISHWGPTSGWTAQQRQLTGWIKEICDASIAVGRRAGLSTAAARLKQDDQGLLTNYWQDDPNVGNPWFGETTGTALMGAVVYRMLVLAPGTFSNSSYYDYATLNKEAIADHVYSNGIMSPAVDPYNSQDMNPYTQGSPEGQSFGGMLYAAFRDCVCAGRCAAS